MSNLYCSRKQRRGLNSHHNPHNAKKDIYSRGILQLPNPQLTMQVFFLELKVFEPSIFNSLKTVKDLKQLTLSITANNIGSYKSSCSVKLYFI